MASLAALLRGACQCGRYQYSIQVPKESVNLARIVFDSDISHQISSVSPSSAFIRIPILWYHSEAFPLLSDESRLTIRRSYSHPAQNHTQRRFCGYCGTLLSYWFEEPSDEAEYILSTLESLLSEDLPHILKLGLLPDAMEQDQDATTGIPWFDRLVSVNHSGTMHTTEGVQQSLDGTGRVESEITEWTAGDNEDEGETGASESSPRTKAKRKREGNGKDNTGAFSL